jgi:Ca2+-binding RTX toxin-like protein
VCRLYDFLLQQLAAESYLSRDSFDNEPLMLRLLRNGNNRIAFATPLSNRLPGTSQLTEGQADDFLKRFQILDQWSDDPRRRGNVTIGEDAYRELAGEQILANSGLSVTLTRDIDPTSPRLNSVTLSIRSTESLDVERGGDRMRDMYGADLELLNYGVALAQLDALDRFYQWLQTRPDLLSGPLYVTGYSLGGHLAQLFTEMHPEAIAGTVVFNAPGRGSLGRATSLQAVLDYYRQVLRDPAKGPPLSDNSEQVQWREDAVKAASQLNPVSIYSDVRERWAAWSTQREFGLVGALTVGRSTDIDAVAAEKITAWYGHADTNDSEVVANLGIHAPSRSVFIEDQPAAQGFAGLLTKLEKFLGVEGDFGTTHSITLMGDALAVIRVLAKLDREDRATASDYLDRIRPLLSTASNARAEGSIGSKGLAEFDPLENVVRALGHLLRVELDPMDPGHGGGDFADIVQRDAFHENLRRIDEAAGAATSEKRYDIQLLGGMTPAQIEARATATDEHAAAWRYAVLRGNPFVVLGFDYAGHNAAGELDLHDPETRRGDLTTDWLKDRSFFLASKAQANLANVAVIENRTDEFNWKLSDIATGYVLSVLQSELAPGADGGQQLHSRAREAIVFGGDSADALQGTDNDDRLYGGRGTDFLRGKEGDDRLEGGEGLDVYSYGASKGAILGLVTTDGNDTIRDTDGRGVLRYVYDGATRGTAIAFDAHVKLSDTRWSSADGRFEYEKRDGDLVVTVKASPGGTFTLKNFRDGDFGIRLASERSMPQIVFMATGDTDPARLDDFMVGRVVTENSGITAVPTLPGNPGDRLDGGEGNDEIIGDYFPFDHPDPNGLIMRYGVPMAFPEHELIFEQRAKLDRDWLLGGPGRDAIFAGGEADLVEGGADGILRGAAGGDMIDGGVGDDVLYGDVRIPIVDAIREGDIATGTGLKGDGILGGAGDDWVVGAAGNDWLAGGGGDDLIVGGGGDDDIQGDSGAFPWANPAWRVERVRVFEGENERFEMVLHDMMVRDLSPAGRDTIHAGAGDDWVYGNGADDLLDGGTGHDVLVGGAGSDVLLGGAGRDVLLGDDAGAPGSGADYLDGGLGEDRLEGGAGDDVLAGGPGADVLVGGAGRDIYLFEKGDGQDIVADTPGNARSADASILVFGDGVKREDIKFRIGSLAVDYGLSDPDAPAGDRDVVHVDGFDPMHPTDFGGLAELRFVDGTVMDYAAILAQGFDIDGTDANDGLGSGTAPALVGSAVVDRIRGFGGQDALIGHGGDDVLDGGDGDDYLRGDDGGDLLHGGAGEDDIEGGAGDDTLIGGAGRDRLDGGEGDDVYDFAPGDGADTILDTQGRNRIRFAAGITSQDLAATRLAGQGGGTYASFTIGSDGDGDEILFRLDAAPGALAAFTFAFADGTQAEALDVFAASMARASHIVSLDGGALDDIGGPYADRLWGGPQSDTLRGMGGNDELGGAGGNDVLLGGDGDDLLVGGGGDDVLDGGAGRDTYRLTLAMGLDRIVERPDDVSVLEFGTDFLLADTEAWRRGTDLVVRLRGVSEGVTIADYFDLAGTVRQTGWRVLEGDVDQDLAMVLPSLAPAPRDTDPAALEARYRADLHQFLDRQWRAWGYVPQADGGYRLTYERTVGTEESGRTFESHVATLRLDDVVVDPVAAGAGQPMNVTESQRVTRTASRTVTRPGGGSVDLRLGNGGDLGSTPYALPSTNNFPYVDSSGRSARIDGGVGGSNPYLYTSPVDGTTYYFPRTTRITNSGGLTGDGGSSGGGPTTYTVTDRYVEFTHDQIVRLHDLRGGAADDLAPAGLWTNGDAPDSGVWFFAAADGGAGADRLGLQPGSQTGYPDLPHRQPDAGSSAAPVHVPGLFLNGNDGNDDLRGGSSDDVLVGGRGNDFLAGGAGDDRYVLEAGGGRDTIYDGGEVVAGRVDEDVVVLPDGVRTGDLRFAWHDALHVPWRDLSMQIPVYSTHAVLGVSWGTGDGVDIVLPHRVVGAGTGIDLFRFADGTELVFADILARAPLHALDPSLPDETLVAATSGSPLSGSPLSGSQLSGEDGDDTLTGGAAADLLVGGNGRDVITGGAGDDWLVGGELIYVPFGDSADWTGSLWDGGNVFRGGAGDDLIVPGGGSDVFEFDRGDGRDTIRDALHVTPYTDAYTTRDFAADSLPDVPWPADFDPYARVVDHRAQLVDAADALRFGAGIRPEHIVATHEYFDLVVHYAGPFTEVRFANWFATPVVQLQRVVFDDGTMWNQAQLLARIDAPYHPDVANHAPVAQIATQALRVRAGETLRWTLPAVAFRDDDFGDAIALSIDSADGGALPGWASVVPIWGDPERVTSQAFTLVPDATSVGRHGFVLTAIDLGGLAATIAIDVEVLAPNTAPVLVRPLANLTAGPARASSRALDLAAFVDVDPDDALRFELAMHDGSSLPAWMQPDLATGRIGLAPTAVDAGVYTLRLRAIDGAGADTVADFTVTAGASLLGTASSDTLSGTAGDDLIVGGMGFDRLTGFAGDDTYRFGSSDGADLIVDSAGNDRILFASSLTPDSVVVRIGMSGTAPVARLRLLDAFGAEMTQGIDMPLPIGTSTASSIDPSTLFLPVELAQFGTSDPISLASLVVRERSIALSPAAASYVGNRDDETIVAGAATTSVSGGSGHDVVMAAAVGLTARGGGGEDYLQGGAGADRLFGEASDDVLSGRAGNDVIDGGGGADFLMGGSGDDQLSGGTGMDMLAGGAGADVLTGLDSGDLVAFNRGDGADRFVAPRAGFGTLSLGGGLGLADLSLTRTGADLVLHAGDADSLTFEGWYAATPVRPLTRLQVVAVPSTEPVGSGVASSAIADQRAEWFSLTGIVSAYDAAAAKSPGLSRWAIADAAAAFHQGGSDDRMFGGDLAWWFARGAPEGGLSVGQARAFLEAQVFAAQRPVQPTTSAMSGVAILT